MAGADAGKLFDRPTRSHTLDASARRLRAKAKQIRMLETRRARGRMSLLSALIILFIALLLFASIAWLVERFATRSIEQFARAQAAVTASDPGLIEAWQQGDSATIQALITRWSSATNGRVEAFSPEGARIATTDPALDGGGSGASAAEIRQAITHGFGRAVRRDGPNNARTLYVALPVGAPDAPLGVLRWAVPFGVVSAEMRSLEIAVATAIALAALLLIGLMLLARERNAAMQLRLTEMVERALTQDFEGHVLEGRTGELERLTQATNRLVDKYRKASKRRARERDRLHTILMHMSNGALILSEAGRVRLINPAAAEILRTTPDEAMRKSFAQVVWDHRIIEVWQRGQQSRAEETESIELSSDQFVRVTVTPFLGGDAAGYLVILQDLSAVRRLEKVRRDFISNVSHELRTPLASLAALVDTLRDGALDDPPAAQRFLDRMEVEVDKMTQMVQELLELSRVESGQLPLRLSPTSVQQIVNPAVDRLATQAERAELSVQVELPAGLPSVMVDSERMQQVMINLIHNAIKFTPSGGSITISAAQDTARPGMLVVCVRDTGVGIPAANLSRIFERFYKADRARSGGGTGLGLAIAKHTVLAHGGTIWVTSREGEGSTVYFTLPTETGEDASAATALADAAATAPSAS